MAREKGILPDESEAAFIAQSGEPNKYDVLDWLASKDILPDVDYNDVIGYKDITLLEWLLDHGTDLDNDYIELIVDNGWIEALELLYKKKGSLDEIVSYWAAKHGRIDVLNWTEQKGILPNYIPEVYIDKNKEEVLTWLNQRGIYPS